MKSVGYEKDLFSSWEDWDESDCMVQQFYGAVLCRDLSLTLKAGDRLDVVTYDFPRQILTIYGPNGEELCKRKIVVCIGEPISDT